MTAQRIYQDLVSDHGYAGSYYSVRRLIRKISGAPGITEDVATVRAS